MILSQLGHRDLYNLLHSLGPNHRIQYKHLLSYIKGNKLVTKVSRYDLAMFKENCVNEIVSCIDFDCSLEVLKWLVEQDYIINEQTMSHAALSGNLENIKWLKKNEYPWDEWTFKYAAQFGNLEIMKWLLNPTDDNGKSLGTSCPWDGRTFDRAVKNGNLDNVKWLKENGCPGSYCYWNV
jgi:hypothetical protein